MSETRLFHYFTRLLPELRLQIGLEMTDNSDLFQLARTNREMYTLLATPLKSRVLAANKVNKLKGTQSNSFFVTEEQKLHVCGDNTDDALGVKQEIVERPLRLKFGEELKVKSVIAKTDRTFVLMVSGEMFAFGKNDQRQLFVGNRTCYQLPIRFALPPIQKIKMIHGALLMLAMDGSSYGCGNNSHGQLGFGHIRDITSPQKIPLAANIKQIAGADNSLYQLRTDGKVLGGGDNRFYQLGQIDPADRTIECWNLILISGLEKVERIWAITDAAFFRVSTGELYALGRNTRGRLGVNSNAEIISVPTRVQNVKNVSYVREIGDSVFFGMPEGRVASTGFNEDGRLGLGDALDRKSPQLIPNLSGVTRIGELEGCPCFFIPQKAMKICGDAHGIRFLPGRESFRGQLLEPQDVPELVDIKKSMHGRTVFSFLSHDGLVQGWGNNQGHVLGLPELSYDVLTPIMLPHIETLLERSSTVELIALAHQGNDYYHQECLKRAFARIREIDKYHEIIAVLPHLNLKLCAKNEELQNLFPGALDLLRLVEERDGRSLFNAYAELLLLYRSEIQMYKRAPHFIKRFNRFLEKLAGSEEVDRGARRAHNAVSFFKAHDRYYNYYFNKLHGIAEKDLVRVAKILLANIELPVEKPPVRGKRRAEEELEEDDQHKFKKAKR